MTNDEWVEQQDEHFRNALQRPPNYHELSPEHQWAIDKALGLLDWTGPRDDFEWNRLREHHGLTDEPTPLRYC